MKRFTSIKFRNNAILIALFFLSCNLQAQTGNEWFSFDIPPLDTSTAEFLPKFNQAAIGNTHFVTINPEGHFEVNGEPMRFWGTPVSKNESASLPKNSYTSLIKEFKKSGVNIIRFHLWDSKTFNGNSSIFGSGTGTRTLDSDALDRLDYLIYLMKQNGIYAYVDLLCDRHYTNADGVYSADSTYKAAKIVNFYDPKLIELQKEYAQKLLTHVNPYTGNALVNEPVMALMDIVNEGWFLHALRSNQVKPASQGGLLSQYHYTMLEDLWNDFLMDKYLTADAVRQAWGLTDPDTEEISNGGFETGTTNWSSWGPGNFIQEISTSESNTGSNSFHVHSTAAAANGYECQIRYTVPFFVSGKTYEIRFFAKSAIPQEIAYTIQINQEPWTSYSLKSFTVSGDWTEYSAKFTINNPVSDIPYLYFNLGLVNGDLWIDDVSLKLSAYNSDRFGLVSYSDLQASPQKDDQAEFYIYLQQKYYSEMYDYLKNDLGVKIPVTGSNYLSGIPDIYIQRNSDFIDNHGYWDSWVTPEPTSMIQHPNYKNPVLLLFSGNRIEGKPLTASEFNYQTPNPFAYEGLFFLSAYGSFHNADLLMVHQLEYTPSWDFWNHQFNSYQQIAYRALQPTFSYAYRNNLISKANQYVTLSFSEEDVYANIYKANPWSKDFNPDDYPFEFTYQHGVKIDFNSGVPYNRSDYPATPANPYVTDNGEISWDSAGLLSVNTPELCGLVGKLDKYEGKTLGAVKLTGVDKSSGITLLALDNKPLGESEKMLLTVVTAMKNTGMTTDGFDVISSGSKPRIVEATNLSVTLTTSADSIKVYWLNESGHKSGYSEIFRNNGSGQIPVTLNTYDHPGVWFGLRSYCSACEQEPVYTISAAANPANAGTNTGTGNYEEDETATLKAIPAEGYKFVNWSANGNTILENSEYSFIVRQNTALTANYKLINSNSALNSSLETVRIFPNPVEKTLTVTGLPDNTRSVTVFTTDGRMIIRQEIAEGTTECVLDFVQLSAGVYYLLLSGENFSNTRVIIKKMEN